LGAIFILASSALPLCLVRQGCSESGCEACGVTVLRDLSAPSLLTTREKVAVTTDPNGRREVLARFVTDRLWHFPHFWKHSRIGAMHS